MSLESFVKEGKVAGAVVAVARRGRIIHQASVGKGDVTADNPLRPDAIFRIYSMTKPITTVAALILWEEGLFKLDDPVSSILKDLKGLEVYQADGSTEDSDGGEGSGAKAPVREMTVRDLMRHTSGLTYGFFGSSSVDRIYLRKNVLDPNGTLEDMVRKLGDTPLLHAPGTKFEYSVSTDVLGRIVEVLSKEPLDAFLEERIFVPLDMKDTAFHVPPEKLARFTANHGPGGEGVLKVVDSPATSRYREQPSFLSGGGGLVSTLRDYLRFCQMLLDGGQLHGKRILKEETVALMRGNQLPPAAMPMQMSGFERPGVGFGLGVSVRVDVGPLGLGGRVGEYGWGGAASTHFWISPDDRLVVVALQQYMPYTALLEQTIKPIVYRAIEK